MIKIKKEIELWNRIKIGVVTGFILGSCILINLLNYNYNQTNSEVYFNITHQDFQNIIIHTLIDMTISVEFADRIVNIYRKDTLCTSTDIHMNSKIY